MVIPLAMMGAGAGVSMLSGLGMGFGYGYGVRAGYNSYKPSKSQKTNNMVLSPNPVTSGTGMGLHTAEQQFDKKTPLGLSDEPPTAPPEVDPTTKLVSSKATSLKLPMSRFQNDKQLKAFKLYGKIPRAPRESIYGQTAY